MGAATGGKADGRLAGEAAAASPPPSATPMGVDGRPSFPTSASPLALTGGSPRWSPRVLFPALPLPIPLSLPPLRVWRPLLLTPAGTPW